MLPYSQIHCPALAAELAPALDRRPQAIRNAVYVRAMGTPPGARVLSRSFAHRRPRRRRRFQACFTLADLTAEHFAFAADSLAKLRIVALEKPAGSAVEAAGDR